MDFLSEVSKIEALQHVPTEQLQWLIDKSTPSELAAGEFLFKSGEPMDRLFVILNGNFVIKFNQNGQYRVVANIGPHSLQGLLPYSRGKEFRAEGEATIPGTVLILHKDHFREMIRMHEELTTAMVHEMSTRIREYTKVQQQNEKMLALGKISAGLAHELNNPSAAVVRSSRTLKEHLSTLPERFKKVMEIKMTEDQIDVVNTLLFSKVENEPPQLSLMQKSNLEDEFLDWLEDRDIEEAEEISENMVEFGFSMEDLETFEDEVPAENMGAVINWVNQVLTTEKLVNEIEEASQRINDLVLSIKSYTHMDQSPEKKMASIHEGLDNTLVMLDHKIRKENVELVKKYDEALLEAEVLPSALNQVWTNLIDNAVDAMKSSELRQLTVETLKDGEFVNVNIQDTGSGIPEEVIDKIYDPFFTTKEIGEGTGIGLEVVHRIITNDHNGSIKVNSKPGSTIFKICFPIKS